MHANMFSNVYLLCLQLLDSVGAESGRLLRSCGLHRPSDLRLLLVHLHPAAQTPRAEIRAEGGERGTAATFRRPPGGAGERPVSRRLPGSHQPVHAGERTLV